MTSGSFKATEEEILLAFSVEPRHDRETLERYLNEYPEHAEALAECSTELMLGLMRNSEAVEASESAVDLAWERFQAVLSSTDDTVAANPFAKLNPTAFKALARRLDINNLFLARLRDRAIAFATIPQRFIDKLAQELGVTAEAVVHHLNGSPTMMSGQKFRSSVKPAVTGQISFEEAIDSSQLEETQKEALRALKD